jgi:glyoxylase-like metal-dependent hydrolase (beta-lactamase superfamily II)
VTGETRDDIWGSIMTAPVAQQVGDLEILPIIDGYATYDARSILLRPSVDGDPWAAHEDMLNEHGQLELIMGAYLIPVGDRRILIDAGLGAIENEQYHGGGLLTSLAAAGVAPGEVTDVVLTHLHFDHVGWTTRKGDVVFENATYRCHAADWAHFIEGADADAAAIRKLSPLADQLELFDTDHTLVPGVDLRHAPGHTPGSVIIVVSDGEDRAMLLGDIVHCPAELIEDEWEAVFDLDRALARQTREALARELEGTTTAVGAAHFPGLKFGRLLSGAGQRSWVIE